MPVGVEVHSDDLREVSRALRGLEDGKALRKQLRKNITAAARPAVPAIRARVKGLPSKGGPRRGRPPLRISIAKATRLQVQMSGRYAGVTIRVDPRKMPPGMRNLPGYLEGAAPFERWRHPVYGRRDDTWVQQRPHPFFFAVAYRYEPAVRQAVAESVETIRRHLAT